MDRNFTAGAIFTLLFAVSAARISLDPTPIDLRHVQSDSLVESLPESASGDSTNLVVLPTETTKSGSDAAGQEQKSSNDRKFKVDLTPRSDYARFHAINRRFSNQHRVPIRFDHHRPYRHLRNPFVLPRSEISHRNEVIVTGETGNIVARNLHRRGSSLRPKFKREYGHHHRHQHHHMHRNKDVSMPKHNFAPEKVQSLVHEHKEKTEEHQASSFMKSIRKFLKHTFD